MDIDTFSQCLNYIQGTSTKSSMDKYLPLIGTVVGAGLAFGLNFFSNSRKDNKTKIKKKDCCEEDCHELMNICHHSIHSLMELCEPIAKKRWPTGHNLVSVVSLPLLDKYYAEIAHSFSVNQRYWIKLVFRNVENINGGLSKIIETEDGASLYRLSINLINLQATMLETYRLCYCILDDKKYDFSEIGEALAELGIPADSIGWLKLLQENADSDNTTLKIPNN